MRHAVLGAGGVGGLLAGALARAGREVVLLMRPQSLARYDGTLRVDSTTLGDFAVPVPAAEQLTGPADVLWLTVKATQLDQRPPELDAIAGAVLRAGRRHGIPTPATERLVSLVHQRIATGRPAP